MKAQEDAITEDEWILRRVHRKDFDSLDPPSIQLYAFKPTVKGNFVDESGISFYRQACIQNTSDVLAKVDAAKRCNYGVVRLPLLYLWFQNLDVIRDDDDKEPIVFGHVVMPAINSRAYTTMKDEVLPKMKLLADYVNSENTFLILPDARKEG